MAGPEDTREILVRELECILEPLGMQLVELSVYAGKRGLNIRAVVYKHGGVTLEDCERVNRLYNDRITILEPIDENNYTLQVSSPGIDRVFKDKKEYTIFRMRHVTMVVDEEIDGSEGGVVRGVLEGLENDHVVLVPDGDENKRVRISLESVRKTRLDG